MIIDLADERREAKLKYWLEQPVDDRDVTNGYVYEDASGKPACKWHGAMNRISAEDKIYRCSEFHCGVGAEVI